MDREKIMNEFLKRLSKEPEFKMVMENLAKS